MLKQKSDFSDEWVNASDSRLHLDSQQPPASSLNIIDILKSSPTHSTFPQRVKSLGLSSEFEEKILRANTAFNTTSASCPDRNLTEDNEKELAAEVLLHKHKFTILVFNNRAFRQAAITVIQNSYLFKQRKIFFKSAGLSTEQERQEALQLFTMDPRKTTIPLGKTFQHLVLARIWDRIIQSADSHIIESQPFAELSDVVARLNTLRNIYMLLTANLVKKLTSRINQLYRHSVTAEDACQIGSFGIARAAYRYHPSVGVRFSTYAAHWVQKEIQRQALEGRLIRISSDLVEKFSQAKRGTDRETERVVKSLLENATEQLGYEPEKFQHQESPLISANPAELTEQKELHHLLLDAVDKVLSGKSRNIINRRYGLGAHDKGGQSAVAIAKMYGVTRGSIYQLEQSAIRKLKKYFATERSSSQE
jgi:RNA polymerase sigma factor (sigma-70 family)